MQQMTHKQELIFYYGLLVAVITGIIASILLLVLIPQDKESFSAIYYPQPDQLPNKVRTGVNYPISYTVQSHENQTKIYDIQTTLTLYELYDETEGLHNCLRPYRKKIYLNWINETPPHLQTNNESIIPSFHAQPDHANHIEWDEYHANIGFNIEKNNGTFLVYFANETKTKYTIKIDTKTGEAYYNNQTIGTVTIEKQNSIEIHYTKPHLQISINKELQTTKTNEEATKGQFGFESKEGFIKPGLGTYKDKPIEVPDKGNIWDYEFNLNNHYYKNLYKLNNRIRKTITTQREYINDELQNEACKNDFTCNYLNEREGDYQIENTNITNLLLSLPQRTYGNVFWIRPENQSIPFENYTITTSHPVLGGNDSLTIKLSETLSVTSTAQSTIIMSTTGEEIRIHKQPLKVNASEDDKATITIQITADKATISTNNRNYTTTIQEKNHNITYFAHNTYQAYYDTSIHNDAEICEEKDSFAFCTITIQGISANPRQPRPTQDTTTTTANKQEEKNTSIWKQLSNIIQPKTPTTNQEENQTTNQADQIPTKTYAFNGARALISNKTNVTFSIQTLYLDGDGGLQAAFNDMDGTPIITATTNPQANRTVIIYEHENIYENKTVKQRLNKSAWIPLEIRIGEDIITITQDRKTIGTFKNINVKDGYFSVSTINMHAELKGAQIEHEGNTQGLNINDDPCQLKPIHEETLRGNRFALKEGANHTFEDNFQIRQDFDYGKISTTLIGSSNTQEALEIHAWLVRE